MRVTSPFPQTTCLISEAIDLVGRYRFGEQWTGKEIQSRRLPKPETAEAAETSIVKDAAASVGLSSILGSVVTPDQFRRWPAPNSEDYRQERAAYLRFSAARRDLVDALRYGHVDSWLITDKSKRIDIPAHWWEEPMRLSVAAFLGSDARETLATEIDMVRQAHVTRQDLLEERSRKRLQGRLFVDCVALAKMLTLRSKGRFEDTNEAASGEWKVDASEQQERPSTGRAIESAGPAAGRPEPASPLTQTNGEPPSRKSVGRPSCATDIMAAYVELRDSGGIDFSAPKNRVYPSIREAVRKKLGTEKMDNKGLGNEAIRNAISSQFDIDKAANKVRQ